MAKPIVILADTDEKYLSPLEIKFLEELDDTIELEIITDENYFNEYFAGPKNADVLVVSEELYTRELQKHNISNLFVLTEKTSDMDTEELRVTKIFKYTSIKEIYNQVISASVGKISDSVQSEKETKVVLMCSASGGTGKTTLAMGISACLAQNYKRVLYINAEGINAFQFMLCNDTAIPSNSHVEFKTLNASIFHRIKHVIRNEGFDYLPPFGAALSSLDINYAVYKELITSAKLSKEYDVIVVDTDSIFNEAKAELIMGADKVFMVVKQTKTSVFAMNVLLKNFNCNDPEKFFFICNNFDKHKENALLGEEVKPKFVVSDYVDAIDGAEYLPISDLAKKPDIQKISYLIV